MDFKEFCGLLQDHVSWYQDSYFLYLLEHVNQATSKEQNGDDESNPTKNDDSDDDVIIVKEVRSKDNNIEKTEKVKPCVKGSADMKSNNLKEQKTAEQGRKSSVQPVSTSDVGATPHDSKPENQNKRSPVSDGSKKAKSRKRKPTVPLEDSDDSDSNNCKRQIKIERTNNISKTENKNIVKEGNDDVLMSNVKLCSNEETAKWVLQLPNVVDQEHSEDPEDESDDEDSETYLQLTYGMFWKLFHQSLFLFRSTYDVMKFDCFIFLVMKVL